MLWKHVQELLWVVAQQVRRHVAAESLQPLKELRWQELQRLALLREGRLQRHWDPLQQKVRKPYTQSLS